MRFRSRFVALLLATFSSFSFSAPASPSSDFELLDLNPDQPTVSCAHRPDLTIQWKLNLHRQLFMTDTFTLSGRDIFGWQWSATKDIASTSSPQTLRVALTARWISCDHARMTWSSIVARTSEGLNALGVSRVVDYDIHLHSLTPHAKSLSAEPLPVSFDVSWTAAPPNATQ